MKYVKDMTKEEILNIISCTIDDRTLFLSKVSKLKPSSLDYDGKSYNISTFAYNKLYSALEQYEIYKFYNIATPLEGMVDTSIDKIVEDKYTTKIKDLTNKYEDAINNFTAHSKTAISALSSLDTKVQSINDTLETTAETLKSNIKNAFPDEISTTIKHLLSNFKDYDSEIRTIRRNFNEVVQDLKTLFKDV